MFIHVILSSARFEFNVFDVDSTEMARIAIDMFHDLFKTDK